MTAQLLKRPDYRIIRGGTGTFLKKMTWSATKVGMRTGTRETNMETLGCTSFPVVLASDALGSIVLEASS